MEDPVWIIPLGTSWNFWIFSEVLAEQGKFLNPWELGKIMAESCSGLLVLLPWSEVANQSVSARPSRIPLRARMAPGCARDNPPTSGPGRFRICKRKDMANLDGTLSDPGWDLDGPRIGLGIGPRIGSRLRFGRRPQREVSIRRSGHPNTCKWTATCAQPRQVLRSQG